MTHTAYWRKRRRRRILVIAVTCWSLGWMGVGLQATHAGVATTKEYKVKASCLLNFALFVQWPQDAFVDATAPLTIGVLGDDKFGAFFDQLIRDETIEGRPLVVTRSRSVEDLTTCQMVFVSKSETPQLTRILSCLGGASILTVGETEDFARHGGVINFFLEGEKLRFEINPSAASHSRLKLSSQLLSLGKIVSPINEKENR